MEFRKGKNKGFALFLVKLNFETLTAGSSCHVLYNLNSWKECNLNFCKTQEKTAVSMTLVITETSTQDIFIFLKKLLPRWNFLILYSLHITV